jgi:signal transduction histidine kinase
LSPTYTGLRLAQDGATLILPGANSTMEIWDLRALRGALAVLGLDWGQAMPAVAADSGQGRTLSGPAIALALGFGLVAAAGGIVLLALQRHRRLVHQFVQSEATARQRHRELEVAKVELMHSQKMQALGTLAAGIAHDFNNLLSVIRMSNKLIGRESKGQDGIQEQVADIEQAVLQGKHVVGSMLGYARTEDTLGVPTDVSAAVEDAVSLLSREFLSGLTLTLELEREAPPVNLGRGRLEQVLLNLVVNASEAMQGQGKLKLTVHARAKAPDRPYVLRPAEADRFVELSVVDSGPGIAADVQARLFEPFFTTKRTGAKAGTGLGLSLVYSIAQQEGLGLSVQSEPGKGATFALLMPSAAPPAAPVRQKHSSQRQNPP